MPLRNVIAKLGRPPLWCTLLICAVILGLRRPDVFQSPQFWAEDGRVFFLDAKTLGVASLLEPSAGYLHAMLRIVAWIASLMDPALAPALYIAAAAAGTLYVAARTQSSRFPFAPSAAYAFAVVLVPDSGEVLLTLTNLQWVLAGGLLLVLIAREPERASQRVHDIVAIILLGLTGPFVVPLLPLFVWRARQRRTRFSICLAVLAAVLATLQLALILRAGTSLSASAPIGWHSILGIPGVRVVGSLLTGGRFDVRDGMGWAIAVTIIGVAGIVVLAVRRGPQDTERKMLGLAFAGLLVVVLYRCRYELPALLHGAAPRYFFVLQMIAIWLALANLRISRKLPETVGWCALFVGLILNFPRLRAPAFRDYNWAESAAKIRKGERVVTVINPDWPLEVPGKIPEPVVPAANENNQGGLLNLSARFTVTAEKPAMTGFTLRAGPVREYLVRAVGPSLAMFGIADPLVIGKLVLRRDGVEVPGFNPVRSSELDDRLGKSAERCGAFALQPNAGDLSALVELEPGSYSLVVTGDAGRCGEVILEVYEVPAKGSAN
jgi:hypothetical protein